MMISLLDTIISICFLSWNNSFLYYKGSDLYKYYF